MVVGGDEMASWTSASCPVVMRQMHAVSTDHETEKVHKRLIACLDSKEFEGVESGDCPSVLPHAALIQPLTRGPPPRRGAHSQAEHHAVWSGRD